MHLAEAKFEYDDALRTRHMTPTRLVESLGVLDGWTIVAHAIYVDASDAKILKAHGTGVAHCPSSNMKLASGIAPVVKMLALGIPVGIGTDGPAGSNNDFDMMEEMNLAADLQKVANWRSHRASGRAGRRHGDHPGRTRRGPRKGNRLA